MGANQLRVCRRDVTRGSCSLAHHRLNRAFMSFGPAGQPSLRSAVRNSTFESWPSLSLSQCLQRGEAMGEHESREEKKRGEEAGER